MKPIYKPKGAAEEYGDYALNIYTGCPHRCYYCFAPQILHRSREKFHSDVRSRDNIIDETRKQLEREQITGKTIHLCFTCDPYPVGFDTTPTREIIKLLKQYENYVQILTKGDGGRDFDLLDGKDWYGITLSCGYTAAKKAEPFAVTTNVRVSRLEDAKRKGVNTWISFEPVISTDAVLNAIVGMSGLVDKVKIGKLNYNQSLNWPEFGKDVERLCREVGVEYYIKDGLRKEMGSNNGIMQK